MEENMDANTMTGRVKYGVIGAMTEEVEMLKKDMAITKTEELYGLTFYEGMLVGRNAVLVYSGIGKVNAAVTTSLLIDRFGCNSVIFNGVAGSLHNDIGIMDVVISEAVVQADFDLQALGYELGRLAEFDTRDISADKALVACAKKAAEKVISAQNVYTGLIATSDRFVSDEELKASLSETFGALCTEMEGAAIGQTAARAGVPFVIIRTISDNASEKSAGQFDDFMGMAARHSEEIILNMLSDLQ